MQRPLFEDRSNTTLGWALLVVLVGAASSYLMTVPNPRSTRPTELRGSSETPSTSTRPDPFVVPQKDRPNAPPFCESFIGHGPGAIDVILLLASAGGSAEEREQRLRISNAAHSAMWRLGLHHVEADTIAPPGERVLYKKPIPYDLFVPARWRNASGLGGAESATVSSSSDATATSRATPSRPKLVAWIDNDALHPKPIEVLLSLRDCLEDSNSVASVVAVGPAGSDTLREMLDEGPDPSQKSSTLPATPDLLELYSPLATAIPEVLLTTPYARSPGQTVAERLRSKGIKFIPTITTDDELARALVDELEERGLNLGAGPFADHILFFVERDSIYSASFPPIFGAILEQRESRRAESDALEADRAGHIGARVAMLLRDQSEIPANVHMFTYRSGLDGYHGYDARESHGTSDSTSEWSRLEPVVEAPISRGSARVDYLSRTAKRLDVEFGAKRVRAVGIVGRDVYDKVLILQALKPIFSDAIFFTTDLDARYLDPENLSWTRNLLVASAYGLELGRELQRDIPGFRDCYETSMFLALCLASGLRIPDLDAFLEPESGNLRSTCPSRVFEIGRTRMIPLAGPTGSGRIHPPHEDIEEGVARASAHVASWSFGACITALVLLLVWLAPHTVTKLQAKTRTDSASRSARLPRIFGRSLLSVVLLIFPVWFLLGRSTLLREEPFFLFEGTSIWPTEILRYTTLGLAALFGIHVRAGLRGVRKQVTEILDTDPIDVDPATPRSKRAFFESILRLVALVFVFPFCARRVSASTDNRLFEHAWGKQQWTRARKSSQEESHAESAEVRVLWDRFLLETSPRVLTIRALVASVLYFWAARSFMTLFGVPFKPGRGASALHFDFVLTHVLVFTYLVLTFHAILLTLATSRFVGGLDRWKWNWEWRNGRPPESAALRHGLTTRTNTELDCWPVLDAVADVTGFAQRAVLFPSVVLLLMLISRSALFDNWNWPTSLLLLYFTHLLVLVGCAIALRLRSEQLRRQLDERISAQIIELRGSPQDASGPRAKQLEEFRQHVRELRRGGFRPLFEQPFLHALALPIGGLGLIRAIEALWL